ncbi:MAG: hypothetical protein ABS44_09235 [Chryseobacterium sp. SCN 40-13]|nr:MAG: hypothetical protein ABS44_09235 [Chryseobacterium sp. SCN 40-13]
MTTKIKNIQFFEFNYGDEFDGNICFLFEDGKYLFYKQPIGIVIDLAAAEDTLTMKQHNLLASTLNDIYLLQWENEYSNPHINDSVYWDIEIRYNDHNDTIKFSGSNAYPQSSLDDGQVVITNSEFTTPDFEKLLSTLNTIVGEEKYFS